MVRKHKGRGMSLRTTIYELAAAHRLDMDATRRLEQLAGLHEEPAQLRKWLPRGLAIVAAALGGFGLILWVAANWETFGRFGRFLLLQGAVLVLSVAAIARPGARAPLALLALLAIGGLFAYFGQTYQTGADPWQLFALWAVLALPLCLGARSDVVWTPWAIVVMTAISLWIQAHASQRWSVRPDDLPVHAFGWFAAVALAVLLGVPRRLTGAGAWSLRTAVTLSVILVTMTAIGALFHKTVAPHYLLGLLLLAASAALFAQRLTFDVYALCAVVLGLNALLVGGLARLVFDTEAEDAIRALFIIGLAAAGLLAASVSAILRLTRIYGQEGGLA